MNGYRISRYNSVGYGVMIQSILPSRGPEHCVYADRCPAYFKSSCVAGRPCPAEEAQYDLFVASASKHYVYAKSWLGEDEYDNTIRRLAILSLQKARLSQRLADAVSQEEVVPYGLSESLTGISICRYATALHNEQWAVTQTLLGGEIPARF